MKGAAKAIRSHKYPKKERSKQPRVRAMAAGCRERLRKSWSGGNFSWNDNLKARTGNPSNAPDIKSVIGTM